MDTKDLETQGFKPAQADYFTGKAFVKPLVVADDVTNCNISDVYFEAGCRNNWHTHPSNQILIVKEGVCYYQEDGKPVQHIPTGELSMFYLASGTGTVPRPMQLWSTSPSTSILRRA